MTEKIIHARDLPRTAAAVLKLAGLSQTEAAERLGTSQSRISQALREPTSNSARIIDELGGKHLHLDGPFFKLRVDETKEGDTEEERIDQAFHLLTLFID